MALYCGNESLTKINYSKEFSPLNILSVDCDWIMEPSIQIYNSHVNDDSIIIQQELQNIAPGAIFEANYGKYSQLIGLIEQFKPNLTIDDLFISPSHDNILEAINSVWHIDQPFILWNIDHHHDCGYDKTEKSIETLLQKSPMCSSWIQHLIAKNPNFIGYIWINNYNSEKDIGEMYRQTLPKFFIETSDFSIVKSVKFDKVFMCQSYGWVPERYYPLTNALALLFENFIKK